MSPGEHHRESLQKTVDSDLKPEQSSTPAGNVVAVRLSSERPVAGKGACLLLPVVGSRAARCAPDGLVEDTHSQHLFALFSSERDIGRGTR
jgi:hypothetical protein